MGRTVLQSEIIQISSVESECLEIKEFDDPHEIVVIRHGMEFGEDGLIVYSELLESLDKVNG